MAHGQSDDEIIAHSRDPARFFTENRHISWVLLIATVVAGVFGYLRMPKRKDPEIPVRVAVAVCPWPGASPLNIEQLVARKIEEQIALNASVTKITTTVRTSICIVQVELDERVNDTSSIFADINLKLKSIDDLPQGAGPIQFDSDFGDTSALMLTVASPKLTPVEIGLRARALAQAIAAVRAGAPARFRRSRVAVIATLPRSIPPRVLERNLDLLVSYAEGKGCLHDPRRVSGPGFAGVDGVVTVDDEAVRRLVAQFVRERLQASEFHPDVTGPVVIRGLDDIEARLAAAAADKYSYRELDDFTDQIRQTLQGLREVSRVTRSGVLEQRVFLDYSQERLAAYGLEPASLSGILNARNAILPGGILEVEGRSLPIDPSGEFKNEAEIGGVMVAPGPDHPPVYLRDLVEITRGYESPPRFLNYYTWRDEAGRWQRSRAVTLAIDMRSGEQIGAFGEAVNSALAGLRSRMPEDLIVARTSDQPQQVEESVHLFMESLYEAIVLVVLVALVGFWEWRSALLIALSIPITLAMTFAMMAALGIDIQQVSIASLIIALGLLVDDPVVAGDAIKRELDAGHPRAIAAWLGPTKLAHAIMFATITNIVAYLPLLLLTGDTGRFIYSLPVVLTCSLVASRIVSMTFIPLLGYYLLRRHSKAEPSMEERRSRGFFGVYYRVGSWALDHRWKVFVGSVLFLVAGGLLMGRVATAFFPQDLSYLSYVDVWLPEDATLASTNATAQQAAAVVQQVAAQYGREHPGPGGKPRQVLKSVTTFAGGSGPRFWFSLQPEQEQLNYAQLVLQVLDKHDTTPLVASLQQALSAAVPNARIDVRQLETGSPVGIPVSVRVSGPDVRELRRLAAELEGIFRANPLLRRVRDDWGADTFVVRLEVDPDRANLSGVTNSDVANSSAAGISGAQVTQLREGHRQIPVVARLRVDERARLSDVENLYVYSSQGSQKVPLIGVASVDYGMHTEKIQRRNHVRTITAGGFPASDVLPSEVMVGVGPRLAAFEKRLPPGYRMEVAGTQEEQEKGFGQLVIVMIVSVLCIFVALVIQFRHALKPLIVFAAIPYGMVGAFAALFVTGQPFGFMAFLGVASLIGVIVSHIIVLFDFIEEMHARGEPLRESLLDAGIVRLRPVLVTVGATVLGLFPLALKGGPLWEPLCYVQIGGLLLSTMVTLVMVPVLYTIFVRDLKIVRWEAEEAAPDAPAPAVRS
jgi:multidrug efflux pump subunit AcrB